MDRSLSTTKTYLLSSDKPIKHSRLEARLDNTSGEVEINLCIRYDPKLHSATHLFTRAQRQVHNFYKNVGLSHLVKYRRKPEAKTAKSSAQATKEENPEATEEEILLSLSQEEQEFFNECELSQREASEEEEGLGGAGGFDRKRPPPAKEPEVVASKRTRTELASSEATNAGDKPAAGTSPGSITAGGSKPAATANGPAAAAAAAATGTEDSSAAGSSLTAAATGKGSSNAPATASCSPRVELEATAPAAAADPAMDSPDGLSDLESATAAATAAAAELLSSSESGLFERIVAEAAARLVAKSPSPEDDRGRSHGVSNSSVFARLSRPASSKGSGRDNNTTKPVGSHKGRQSLARGSPQNGRNNQHQDRVVHLSEDEFVSGSPRTHGPNLSAGDSNQPHLHAERQHEASRSRTSPSSRSKRRAKARQRANAGGRGRSHSTGSSSNRSSSSSRSPPRRRPSRATHSDGASTSDSDLGSLFQAYLTARVREDAASLPAPGRTPRVSQARSNEVEELESHSGTRHSAKASSAEGNGSGVRRVHLDAGTLPGALAAVANGFTDFKIPRKPPGAPRQKKPPTNK